MRIRAELIRVATPVVDVDRMTSETLDRLRAMRAVAAVTAPTAEEQERQQLVARMKKMRGNAAFSENVPVPVAVESEESCN